ncbi:hypothetical protein BDN72DRAFT_959680 [Pluteus cervinus]|uniref:Uncharacterized protein n=1 Tax=Pluteus cervinus TaxID=181527 RepID=A0ACD3AUA6_9AGAR|nr:hypothetical protein BDN72DRAFT_959680 [Pluteus cervinus]
MRTQEPCLPAEVWGRIFQLSCRDSGFTGRSLSLASKKFCILSARYKFQSISLQTIKCTLRFLHALRNTPPHLRIIRYLFVAYNRGKAYEEDTGHTSLSQVQMDEDKLPPDHPLQELLVADDNEEGGYFDRAFAKALSEILQLCNTTVTILSVHVDALTYGFFPILPLIAMPQLQELTWHVPLPRESTTDNPPFTIPPQPVKARFPVLEWLWLTGQIEPTNGHFIGTHCPKLLYIRTFLHVEYLQEELVQKAPTLRDPGDRPPTYMLAATPPSVVQHLLDVHRIGDMVNPILQWWLHLYGVDDATLKRSVDPRIKFCIYPNKPWEVRQSDWQDRILGKVGGWDWQECIVSYE